MNNLLNTKYTYTLSIVESLLIPFVLILINVMVTYPINKISSTLELPKALGIVGSFAISFGLSAILLFIYKKLPFSVWKEMVFKKQKILYWILSLLLYFSLLPLTEYVTTLVPTHGIKGLEDLYKAFIKSFEMIFNNPISSFITICILAPILEETIFRGFILQGLLNHKTKPWLAILISAFLFGFTHLNPWQFMGAGILGACFGFIYWRTESLLLCIFLHFLNNTISFTFTLSTQNLEFSFFEMNNYLLFGSVVISLFILYLFYQLTNYAHIRNTK